METEVLEKQEVGLPGDPVYQEVQEILEGLLLNRSHFETDTAKSRYRTSSYELAQQLFRETEEEYGERLAQNDPLLGDMRTIWKQKLRHHEARLLNDPQPSPQPKPQPLEIRRNQPQQSNQLENR